MGTTAQKLQAIQNSKAAIKAAIEAKGVSNVGDVLSTYATKIADIPAGGGSKYGLTIDDVLGDVDANGVLQFPSGTGAFTANDIVEIPLSGMSSKFYNSGITRVSMPNLQSVGNYGLQGCFSYCNSLTTVDLSSLSSVGVSSLSGCFSHCNSLTSIALPSLTTITSGNALEYLCQESRSMTSADLSSLASANISRALQSAFSNCVSLKTVDFSSLSVAGSRALDNCFYGCVSLEVVYFSQANAVPALTYANLFNNTNETFKIVVPDNLYSSWITASNWSSYSSHIISKSDWDALQS